jgi:hypothetical protein
MPHIKKAENRCYSHENQATKVKNLLSLTARMVQQKLQEFEIANFRSYESSYLSANWRSYAWTHISAKITVKLVRVQAENAELVAVREPG